LSCLAPQTVESCNFLINLQMFGKISILSTSMTDYACVNYHLIENSKKIGKYVYYIQLWNQNPELSDIIGNCFQ
jgi:hypothetical protein